MSVVSLYTPCFVMFFVFVIFFWSSGIMECTCMLFTFENGVLLMRQGASVVWHHSLPLINSFNKTEAAVFSCRLCFLRAFPFISFFCTGHFVMVPINLTCQHCLQHFFFVHLFHLYCTIFNSTLLFLYDILEVQPSYT